MLFKKFKINCFERYSKMQKKQRTLIAQTGVSPDVGDDLNEYFELFEYRSRVFEYLCFLKTFDNF